MAKKQIRLTEAKIVEMAVEVAKRMLKEGFWNNMQRAIPRGEKPFSDDDAIRDDLQHDMARENLLIRCKEWLDYIKKNDDEYIEMNPGAYQQAVRYLNGCSSKQYCGDQQLMALKAYVNQYRRHIGVLK